ncbi:hypothetical protein ACB094_04G106400 [Castanea mollissima]
MADERSEDIMPVELAIKRELAYQRKTGTGFKFKFESSPRLNRSPSPGLSGLKRLEPTRSKEFLQHHQPRPVPSLSGFKRLAPTFSKQCLPHQQRHPIYISYPLENPTDPFFCKVSHVPCSSAVTYKSHIRGNKHRAIVGELEFGRKDGAEVAELRSERKKCEFCNVWCMDDDALQQHLEGKQHTPKLQKLELAREGGGQIVKQRKWCKVCNIWCIDESSFKMHLKGQKHLSILHGFPGNRGP